MKMKKITSAALAALLLILFIPVFYSTVFTGNNMDYNADYKIEPLVSNTTLFLYALLALLVFGGLFFLLDKIPVNKYTIAGTILFSLILCVLFYVVKVGISRCIAFYGGWDCGMVANSARWLSEGKDIGYDDYYYIYDNNIPITWLLYVLYQFSGSLADYAYNPEFIWIQFQCLMFALAVFFSVMTVLIISKKIAPTVLCLLVSLLFLGLCPWQIIPYTDGSTIAMSVFVMFLYALFVHMKSRFRYLLWLFMIFAGCIGGIMKATSYVAVIAVVLVDFTWLIFGREQIFGKIQKLTLRAGLLVCGLLLAFLCRSGMYRTVHYVPDRDLQMTWSNYFYNGLNELTTGAVSEDGLIIARSYAGYPRKFRQSVELHYAKDRMVEKGFGGMIGFWLRKQVMNFNDGTFSWYQEGFFQAWEYEDITDSRFKESLREFYWEDGENYPEFTTWSQGIWIFVQLGIVVEAVCVLVMSVRVKEETDALRMRTTGIVIFIGAFLFVMLFEGRARYLLNNTPVLVSMAVLGYSGLVRAVLDCPGKLRKG